MITPHHLKGIAFGAAAGALWGCVFLAPVLVGSFDALDLTIGRYVAYGILSAVLIAGRWQALKARIGWGEVRTLAWLALCGNVAYYVLLASAVQWGGIAMTSLVIGLLPVSVTLMGRRDQGAIPFGRLVPSLALCLMGTVCIGWQSLMATHASSHPAPGVGLLCAVGALASWTCYAVGNSRSLTRLPHVTVHEWNLLTGVVTGAEALLLIPVATALPHAGHTAAAWATLAGVSIGVAVFASLIGNSLWNRMSRLLPLTMVGQMILFETLFALLYGLAWERRLPTTLEVVAFALIAAGVALCVFSHRPTGANPEAA